mmetsp:Transcript_7635/g.11851  ORF Transcript_7635/g.11851 Transcript_7635/m.11851 type:complete len:272 (-) Transcript_7635:597-1412(-)
MKSQTSSGQSSFAEVFSTLEKMMLTSKPKEDKLKPEWACVTQTYKLVTRLGEGSQGEVILAKVRETKEKVAIKHMVLESSELQYKSVLREIQILKELSSSPETSKHVTRLLDSMIFEKENKTHVFLVLECLPVSLHHFFKATKNFALQEGHVTKIAFGLLSALKAVNDAGVMHRDLKPSNILLDRDLNVKLCDFGLARSFSKETPTQESLPIELISEQHDVKKNSREAEEQYTQHVSTRFYRAPEVILLQRYGPSLDVWSLGCILAELLMH